MSAEIYENDLAVYAETAWHRQGLVLGRLLTIDDMLDHVQPNWPVIEHRQNWVRDNSGQLLPASSREVFNVTTNQPIKSMGDRHTILPYTTLGETAMQFVSQGLSEGVESAGTLMNGAKAYVTMRVNKIQIPGYSEVYNFFTLTDTVDGSGKAKGGGTLGVVVCNNTLQAYVMGRSFGKAWEIRHTGSVGLNWDEAVEAYIENQQQAVAVANSIERLLNESYVEAQWAELVDQLTGPRPEEPGRSRTMWTNRRNGLQERYLGDDIAPIRDTKWGALMAVQGYEQHVQTVRGADRDERHADNLMFGQQKLTVRAAELIGV